MVSHTDAPRPGNGLPAWGDDLSVIPGSGLRVPSRLQELLAQPGFLKYKHNGPGQRARDIYVHSSLGFDPLKDLSAFGLSCYTGVLGEVVKLVESGMAPRLTDTETAFQVGYASIVVWGSQRVTGVIGSVQPQHLEVLQFLIKSGLPVNQSDIMGLTPVHHYLMNSHYQSRCTPILESLLKAGGSPDTQDKLGAVALQFAFEHTYVAAIELLMKHGADMSIADSEGITPGNSYIKFGPVVTAVVERGLSQRSGERKLREEKSCDKCNATDKQLKTCARCHVARYCSVECQSAHWAEHKPVCSILAKSDRVVVKPFYEKTMSFYSISDLARQAYGTQTNETYRQSTEPKVNLPKNVVIKVQIPNEPTRDPNGSMLVYTKKKSEFICLVRRIDDTQAYDRLYRAIKEKGVQGLKAYFSATIHSKDKLEIKVSEVLAPQPF